MGIKRRNLLLGMAALAASPAIVLSKSVVLSKQLQSTPRQMAGPFYPLELPLDNDNDLTVIKPGGSSAKGEISDLTGKIIDLNGRPLAGMRIEIWQCDANGRYRHPRENGSAPIDQNFQGHGTAITDSLGQYRFRTIKPVAYPGRTPHIHVAVFPEGEKPFVTQLYIQGHEANQDDFLYKNIPVEKRNLVLADFIPNTNKPGHLQASFDIILDRLSGTPVDAVS